MEVLVICNMLFSEDFFVIALPHYHQFMHYSTIAESAERYMEPEIIIKRMVGECSSSVTDSTIT